MANPFALAGREFFRSRVGVPLLVFWGLAWVWKPAGIMSGDSVWQLSKMPDAEECRRSHDQSCLPVGLGSSSIDGKIAIYTFDHYAGTEQSKPGVPKEARATPARLSRRETPEAPDTISTTADEPALEAELAGWVREDWGRQERRRGDRLGSPGSLRRVLERAEKTLAAVASMLPESTRRQRQEQLHRWRHELEAYGQTPSGRAEKDILDRGISLYIHIRSALRQWVLEDARVGQQPILFLKTRRFVCQMLHEYVGNYYNVADLAGGGVYVLPQPGRSPKVQSLTEGRLPRGAFQTLALDYDARRAYFAFVHVRPGPRDRPVQPNWHMLTKVPLPPEFDHLGPQRECFHLYELDLQSRQVRQLTFGLYDDISPCPLPDGNLVFLSTRRGGFTRCNNWWEPLPTYTLHHLDRGSGRITTLSWHETNEWHPTVLHDGRICYSRWDYVDRSAAHFHGLWTCMPDGTAARALFGNYTMAISACFQPRAIPGSEKIAFIAGAHHAIVGGSLVLLDPRRVRLDSQTGQDRFDGLEVLTPDIEFPETPNQWPAGYMVSPWPLDEDRFLVAFGYDRLPGCGSGNALEGGVGLYYFDRWGNLELLYRQKGWALLDPVVLSPRPKPHRWADPLRKGLPAKTPSPWSLGPDEALVYVYDVRRSLLPLPPGRQVDHLRIFQLFPKSTPTANDPRIGHANAENARALLGTVPVEADGSAFFRAPARKPLYFQLVDRQGRAIQGMRTTVYFQPGEQTGCIGCHEPQQEAPPIRTPLALRREPSVIEPGPDGVRPFNFVQLIQPILDRHCVRCHGAEPRDKSASSSLGGTGPNRHTRFPSFDSGRASGFTAASQPASPAAADSSKPIPPILTGQPEDHFTKSYQQLRPYLAFFEWGSASIDQIVTRPGRMGADMSRLSAVLDDPIHRRHVQLSDRERRTIYLWLDANVPFYGTYDYRLQAAQRRGENIPLPDLQ